MKCRLKEKYNNLQKEHEKLEEELKFTRGFIHDRGLEWELLTEYKLYCEKNK